MPDRTPGRTESRAPHVADVGGRACATSRSESCLLPFSLEAPAESRVFVRHVLCPDHGVAALVAVQLVASEIVTDAVLHGKPPVELTLTCQVSEVLVAVSDAGTRGFKPADETDTLRSALIDKVARDRGVETTPHGRLQWCTVPTGYIPRPRSPLFSGPGPAGASASSDA